MFLTVCHFEIHVDSHSYALIIVSLSYRYKYTVLGNLADLQENLRVIKVPQVPLYSG